MAGFVRYRVKNGAEYAWYCNAKRADGVKFNDEVNLGRVIDKERGIYRSRERGQYIFTVERGYVELPNVLATGIYDFGNAYALNAILERNGLATLLKGVFESDYDTLMSLIFYRILQGGANSNAADWFDGSWAKSMFLNANLSSQRLSEFVRRMGDEALTQRFFNEYLKFARSSKAILIDSTGLPNSIDMPITATNCHGGQISHEVRFILVHDKDTNIPLYYRYVAGNIVDVTTMSNTLAELKVYGIDVEFALLDAGYCSEKNVKALYGANIKFITRLQKGRTLYKELVSDVLPTLISTENLVKYRNRLVYIKRIGKQLYGNDGYAYVAVDYERKISEFQKYMFEELENGEKTHAEMDADTAEMGLFILISSEKLDVKEVLPIYYKRQSIEQVFDISKNCAELLPLRVHDEQNFRGHLLLSFITIVAYSMADRLLDNSKYALQAALLILRNLKITVYPTSAIVGELQKKVKDIATLLTVNFPSTLNCGGKNPGN
jgi:hypothetical protein